MSLLVCLYKPYVAPNDELGSSNVGPNITHSAFFEHPPEVGLALETASTDVAKVPGRLEAHGC